MRVKSSRPALSSAGSPDTTMERPAGPNSLSRASVSFFEAASISAWAASCGVENVRSGGLAIRQNGGRHKGGREEKAS